MIYLSVHKTDFPGERHWYIGDPDSFNEESMREVADAIGAARSADRLPAVAYTFSYAAFPLEKVQRSLRRLLALSLQFELPVIVHLDGVNYWSEYPQLYNFWDPSRPGYDPANVRNVERWGWDASCAVKLGWRNWGSQMRVLPAQNLASPAVRAMHTGRLEALLPILAEWLETLGSARRELFGGLVLGWELSPYAQSYFYRDGNRALEHACELDPIGGLESPDCLPLGYAAAQELGIQNCGELREETVDTVCRDFMQFLVDTALRAGIPADALITHSFYGGKTAHGGGHSGCASLLDAQKDGLTPGWSFYGAHLADIRSVLAPLAKAKWAAIEFKPWDLSRELFEEFFTANCRYINIFNWESVRNAPETLELFRQTLRNT